MEERIRDDGFEATFVVSTPRAKAWELLMSAERASDVLPPPAEGERWIPGIEGPAEDLEVVSDELVRCRKTAEPCRGTEIVITMEDAATGTRITIVQTGFGDGFDERRPWLTAGWYAILADLVVFFERGISLGRHVPWWWCIGCDVLETDEGLVVGDVRDDGFAARAGLQRGDLILQLAGAPILDVRDLSILTRGPLRTGVETIVRYLRGEQIQTATAGI
jgi:PDZ domain